MRFQTDPREVEAEFADSRREDRLVSDGPS